MKIRLLLTSALLVIFTICTSADELDKYYSTKRLGSFVENGRTTFRLFAPTAARVVLATFTQLEDAAATATEVPMTVDSSGVWEASLPGEKYGLYYGYKVYRKGYDPGSPVPVCPDPYARALASYNTYLGQRRAIVVKDGNYDWQGDTWIQRDWSDLIIYEMHIRDLTAHSSSGVKHPGTYKGLIERGATGGIDYISSLGVNTVELLPAQEFANIEIPYRDSLAGRFNSWNPYERNHWGYMTESFFAPAAYYAEDWKTLKWNTWMGRDARAVVEFKDMVKAFHKRGIGVLMDVVYNHVSDFESAGLKQIDSAYYFRLDANGHYISESGCGNDFKTERPMARRMIVESVLYWMKEYHIDGFRFDLAKMFDWETVEEIIARAQEVNPAVVIIAEPWGGGYDIAGFSQRGWGAWNDQIRNGVKGQNPNDGLGWIFGKWQGNNSIERLESYVNGTLAKEPGGLYKKADHAVNYLESHDDNTFGDFIRLGLRDAKPDQRIADPAANAKLTPLQLKLNKLGALFLFTSRGMTMIHEGQEYARSKVIAADPKAKDPNVGRIDANSYNKDNETNYLNFKYVKANKNLVDYYKGLIALRNTYEDFRRAPYGATSFFTERDSPFFFGFAMTTNSGQFLVMMNAENEKSVDFNLPRGNWTVLVNGEKAGAKSLGTVASSLSLPPKSGYVLLRSR